MDKITKYPFKYGGLGKAFAFAVLLFSSSLLFANVISLAFLRSILNFVGTVFLAFFSILSFKYLYDGAGRSKHSEVVELKKSDKIWSEIALVIILVCLIIAGIFIIRSVSWSYYDEYSDARYIGFESVFGIFFFLIPIIIMFTFSLVRKYKTQTLYSTSFAHYATTIVRKMSDKYSFRTSAIILTLIFSLTQFLGVFFAAIGFYPLLIIWFVLNSLIVSVGLYALIQVNRLAKATEKMASENLGKVVEEEKVPYLKTIAQNINNTDVIFNKAVKEAIQSERMKAELITNVSHDIKTPLTSIISYVNLLNITPIDDPAAKEYLKILEQKSIKLALLMNDLVDVSKITTGNISVTLECLNVEELLKQAVGEFEEKFSELGIEVVMWSSQENIYVEADGRHMWRVLDNLLSNAIKYTMENTRFYIDVEKTAKNVVVSMKNISHDPLNVPPSELMERFVRGDDARTTEGSGLGLSIAKSLMKAQGSTLNLYIDGDLFKAEIVLNRVFPAIQNMNVVPHNDDLKK